MADKKLLRARFYVNPDDYRPVVWPISHPYWCSGTTDENSIIVAYVESEEEIMRLWPDAEKIDIMSEEEGYTFSDRFPRPEWWKPKEYYFPVLSDPKTVVAKSAIPENRIYHIDGTLPENDEIFVFGSNTGGFHSLGVAKIASQKFGAIRYKGEGLHGKSYALPTRYWVMEKRRMFTLALEEVTANVSRFCQFTKDNPELRFFVTSVGCGLAGFTIDQMAPLFKTAINCSFPENWDIYLEE